MSPYNKLFTKTAFQGCPAIGAQDGKGNEAVAFVKIFSPLTNTRYYVTEFDPATGQGFGLTVNDQGEFELGYMEIGIRGNDSYGGESWQDLNNNFRRRGFPMPPFERASHFLQITLGEIKAKFAAGGVA